jgi:hypothetical protein
MQPKIIKSKNNGCGTAPSNLVSVKETQQYWNFQNQKSGYFRQNIILKIRMKEKFLSRPGQDIASVLTGYGGNAYWKAKYTSG